MGKRALPNVPCPSGRVFPARSAVQHRHIPQLTDTAPTQVRHPRSCVPPAVLALSPAVQHRGADGCVDDTRALATVAQEVWALSVTGTGSLLARRPLAEPAVLTFRVWDGFCRPTLMACSLGISLDSAVAQHHIDRRARTHQKDVHVKDLPSKDCRLGHARIPSTRLEPWLDAAGEDETFRATL